jgi:thiaminase
MVEMAGWLGRQLDHHATGSSLAERDRWLRLYETSTRFELLFFQMAWERSPWPECVPA